MTTSIPKAVKQSTKMDKLTSLQLSEKESLQDANAKLRAALQSERNSLKQLRREMTVQLKRVQEEEQLKAALALKDLKSRFHFEKIKELECQRENMNKKFDSDYVKLVKMKDLEHKKLQNDVRKLQNELQLSTSSLMSTSGLSGSARDTFELERAKTYKEQQELQASKKTLEAEVSALREQERRTCYEVKKWKEDHLAEMARMKKETDVEIRKLLDELKVKERQLIQAQQQQASGGGGGMSGLGGGAASVAAEQLPRTKSTVDMAPKATTDRNKQNHNSNSAGEEVQATSPPTAPNWTPKISELSSKLKVTEEKCKTLEDEKTRLQVRLKEMERKQRPLLEKNKKFLAKNMELSSTNRTLEDKMKEMVQETEKLKSDLKRQQRSLSRHQSVETVKELTTEEMQTQLREQQRKQVEHEKTIAALKLACAEKDRRIELILHRKRKQRASKAQNKISNNKSSKKPGAEKAAGIKETYFGYEEVECSSVADDSEMSLSVCSSTDMLDDEDVFEEFTREEFEANYQRLVKEHLELERSFALLNVSQGCGGVVDSKRETKLRSKLQSDLTDAQIKIKDLEKLIKNQGQKENCKCKDTGWLEEKDKLNKTIRSLKEKIASKDEAENSLQFQLDEIQEQNEVLEFRTLELEEQCENLSEELGQTVTFSGNNSLSDTGLLHMYAEEKGIMEISLADLKENIIHLKEEHGPRLSVEEKVSLVQYIAVVQTSEKKLQEFTVAVAALKSRIKQLEEEKARILSREQGVEANLVLEYEETRNQLLDKELKSQQLVSDIEALKQSEAVHSYKESHFEKLEVRYQEEISELKKRLNSASEGREYENEVFLDKLSQLKNAEKKLGELSRDNENLKSQISELQRECVELHEQLTLQQDTLSLTESDKDTVTQPGPYLKVINLEHSDQESAKKILELLESKSRLSSRLRQLESELESNGESEELKFQLEQLNKAKVKLQTKVQELQDLLDEELSHSATLEKQLSALESSHQTLEKKLITFKIQSTDSSLESQKIIIRTSKATDNNNSIVMETERNDLDTSANIDDKSFNEAVQRNQAQELERSLDEDEDKSFNEAVLRNRVSELEHQLDLTTEEVKHARSELLTLDEDSSRRIQTLEEQIQSMEKNEGRLSETVGDLGEIEKDLRQKLEIYDSKTKQGRRSDEAAADETDSQLQKLAISEQNLKDRVEQMSVNETLLREKLSDVEDKLKKYETNTEQPVHLSSCDSVFGPAPGDIVSQSDENIDVWRESKDTRVTQLNGAGLQELGSVIVLHDSESVPLEPNALNDLNQRICELENAKTELENDFAKLQTENKELVEQVQEFSTTGENEKERLQEQLEIFKTAERKLMEQVDYLEDENVNLKDQVERLSQTLADSQCSSEELQAKLSHMRNREKGLLQVIDTLKEKIDQPAGNDKEQVAEMQELVQLREKVDILLDGEEKLMDKLQEKEDLEVSLRNSIEDYKAALNHTEQEKQEKVAKESRLRKSIEEFEQLAHQNIAEKRECEETYQKQIQEYEGILNSYELEKVKKNETEESLRKTVEEYKQTIHHNELEKVKKNEMEESLRKTVEEYKQTIHQYDLEKVEVAEKLKRLEILEEMQDGNQKLQQFANRRIAELEASEEDLAMKVKHLEEVLEDDGKAVQLNQEQNQRLDHLQREVVELESVLEDYEHQIKDGKQEHEDLRMKLNKAEENEESLSVKVKDLLRQNGDLLKSVQSIKEKVAVSQGQMFEPVSENGHGDYKEERVSESLGELQYVVPEIVTPVSSHVTLRSVLPSTQVDTALSSPQTSSGDGGIDEYKPPTPVDIATLEKMTQEEIFGKIRQLQQMDSFHRIKIEEMGENLEQFRKAVEVIAVAMEADADSPVLKMKPKVRDGDFEDRVNEMVKSEVALKLRVLELEKKEATLSKRLVAAEQALKLQQSEDNAELEELEHRLNQARKSEARLRNQLQYGGPDHESEALARIQELEELVIDLESSDTQLKRQLEDLKSGELKLRCQLEDAESSGKNISFSGLVGPLTSSLRRPDEKDKYWDLVDQVRSLEASEKELKDRVDELRKEDSDQLLKKIATLERSEKGLKLKLDLIEAQEESFLETVDLSMLDSPQEILKQRIRELEQMEKHLRLQVGELEKDREELHEIARKDKNVIHELNVQLRELQLAEKNLKAQLNRYDLEDSKLYSNLDELTDENSELKEQLEKLQSRERSLNAQLQRAQYQATEWQMSLENTKEDVKIAEGKLKKKQQDLEQDRKKLREKSDDHLERISELEADEVSLKQKIRNLENNEKQLKTRITELEQDGSSSGQRTSQLEGLNEILSEKVHKLEEEKSSLMYDVSDLQFNKEEKEHENERLVAQLKSLKNRMEENEVRKCAMQERMDEFALKEIEMHAKLQDLERCDKEWRDRIQFLEHNEQKLRLRIRELEANVSTAENARNLSGDYENEINKLENVAEFHKQESVKLESDKHLLQRKLQNYEYAKANNEMAMIPVAELTELRTQVALLEATEKELERLEEQEACLKKAVEDLRQGKDACGHDFELKDLKEKAELYNNTLKAHELLKEKYEDTKQQLTTVQRQLKTGSVAGTQTSSKAVQVRLVEAYTLKHLSSGDIYFAMDNSEEFKNALKNLGARHPQAYEDFVHLLQPTGRNVSHARVTADPMTLTKQLAGSLQTGAGRPQQVEKGRAHRRRGSRGREEQSENITSSEKQLWRAVEGRRSQEVSDEETDHPHWTQVEKSMSDTEEMTVTMHFEPEQEAGYCSSDAGSLGGGLRKARSTDSVQSTGSQSSLPPPPLPNMAPPDRRRNQSPGNESYYLPSADEASEILDEDDLHPRHKRKVAAAVASGQRAKSVDRDSDFSELTVPLTLAKKKAAASRSLDSIPDDSGYQETDSKILKDRIAHLEAEVKKKDEEVKDLSSQVHTSSSSSHQHSGREEEIKQLKTKLENKERQLETQQRVNRDTRVEVDTKNREVQTLRLKLELLEKTNKKHQVNIDSSPLRVALKPVTAPSSTETITAVPTGTESTQLVDKKDRELRAKSNEVDRLVQELRKWQEDCRTAKDELLKARDHLDKSQGQLERFKSSQEKYEEMRQKYNELNQKHEELVQRQVPLEQASEDKRILEEVVSKLRTQLNDLEGIDLERKSYESKVKALEKEVKQKAQVESELSKENSQLTHLVDSLQRDNTHYRQLEAQYKQVTAQYKTMEEIKTKAQTMITPLRAKVLRLAQKCKTRNQLITRLVLELRKYEEGTPVLKEADALKSVEDDQDYNRPISPLSSRAMEDMEKQVKSADLPQVPSSRKAKPSKSSGSPAAASTDIKTRDSLGLFSDSDTDELLDPKLANGLQSKLQNGPQKAGSAIHYSTQCILYNSRPIKGDHSPGAKTDANANSLKLLNPPQISYKPVTLLNVHGSASNNHQKWIPAGQGEPSGVRNSCNYGLLRAVKDYEPGHFSQSGHPKLELPLKEGDLVKQLGPVDDKGYIEAEHQGCVGLVPFVYLTAASDARRKLPTVPQDETFTLNGSPEQILLMHEELAASHTPQHVHSTPVPGIATSTADRPQDRPTHTSNRKPQRSHSLTLSHPAFAARKPPTSVLLTKPHPPPPTIRSRPTSQPALLIHSRNASPSLSMPPQPPQHVTAGCISLPTSLRNTPVQAHFTSSTPGPQSRPGSTPPMANTTQSSRPDPPTRFKVQRIVGQDGLLLSWEPPTFDELARSNGVPVKGYKITIDNKTSQHIPSPFMSKALMERLNLTCTHSFVIVTMGDGSQTSTPTHTSFTDVLSEPSHNKDIDTRSLAETSLDGSTCHSGERRVYMAVYDYNAKQLSPHKNSNEELSFKTGDVVICYGKPREDGYYFGKVHGKKGLVPASFIEEVAVFGSKTKRSHSSGSHTLSPRYTPSSSSSQSVERTQRAS